MPVLAKSSRYTRYSLASNQAGPFLIGFPLFDVDRLIVYVNEIARTDFSLTTDFSDGVDIAATLTFDLSLESGDVVEIYGDMRADKEREVLAGDADATSAIQLQIARHSAIMQELQRDMQRSIKRSHIASQEAETLFPDDTYQTVPAINTDGTITQVPIVTDPLDATQLTATVSAYFDTAPANGYIRYITNPYTLTIRPTGIIAATYGDAPAVEQVYTILDGATSFATVTFATNGTVTVSMSDPFRVTSASHLRIAAPASVSPAHTKFDITIKGVLS